MRMATPLHDGDPTSLGSYRLVGRLGAGGMGYVFLGKSRSGRLVAVKVVRPELAGDAAFRRRFTTEVSAARKVGGFYTAQVVDADPRGKPPWMATAYIPGLSLHEAVNEHGPLPLASVAVLGSGLAEGLIAVHAAGLVHRDLKPANVILAEDGPRLIDFGIARALDATSQTHTSTVLGTAAFMSPEQALGEEVGPASDVFWLGCVVALAATGHSPFGEGPAHAITYRIVHEEPDLTGVPAPLAELLGLCLAKDPGERPDLEHLLDHLSQLTSDDAHTGQGRWLPDDFTEVIGRHRTLTLTAVQLTAANRTAEPPRAPVRSVPSPALAQRPRLSLADERARALGRSHPHPANAYQYTVYVLLGLFALVSMVTSKVGSQAYEDVLWVLYNFQIVLGSGLVVVWLLWFQRVRATAEELEPGRLRYPIRMAVIGWFIPLANLFLPKMIANDIWHASSRSSADGRMASAGLLHTWWALWLATFLLWPVFWYPWPIFVSFYFNYDLELIVWINLVIHIVPLPAVIAAVWFVHRLTAMQAAKLNA